MLQPTRVSCFMNGEKDTMQTWTFEVKEKLMVNAVTGETKDVATQVDITKFTLQLCPVKYEYRVTVRRWHEGTLISEFHKTAKHKNTIERFLQRLNLPPLAFE